jgi:hypothetical protein
MRLVKQEDPFGCAIACVASILNTTYKDSLKLFNNAQVRVKDEGFYCKEIVEVLRKKGLNYEWRYIKPYIRKRIYSHYSIVYLKKSKEYPQGHYLVRVNNKWMDPWINFPNEDVKAGFRKKLPSKAIYAILRLY